MALKSLHHPERDLLFVIPHKLFHDPASLIKLMWELRIQTRSAFLCDRHRWFSLLWTYKKCVQMSMHVWYVALQTHLHTTRATHTGVPHAAILPCGRGGVWHQEILVLKTPPPKKRGTVHIAAVHATWNEPGHPEPHSGCWPGSLL